MTNNLIKALKVNAAGTLEEGNKFETITFEHSLEAMQQQVGGYLEAITVTNRITMWLNEEGKLLELPLNFYLLDDSTVVLNIRNGELGKSVLDLIVGDVIFTGHNEAGETTSLIDPDIDFLMDRFVKDLAFKL